MWSPQTFDVNELKCFDFGSLRVHIKRTSTTWQFASEYTSQSEEAGKAYPPDAQRLASDDAPASDSPVARQGAMDSSSAREGSASPAAVENGLSGPAENERSRVEAPLVWTTFIANKRDHLIFFRPAVPDRPLVIECENQVQLAPGARYMLFAAVPLWIQAWVGEPGRQLLFDVPTRSFSNTWFGGAMTGRLCYTSPEQVARHLREVVIDTRATSAFCPIEVHNHSHSPFGFSRIAVFADLLKIYHVDDPAASPHKKRRNRASKLGFSLEVTKGDLWTNEAHVVYTAEEELNVFVSERLPPIAGALTLLNSPRVSSNENLLKRGLILLKRISNY